jgi:hypothetical protein
MARDPTTTQEYKDMKARFDQRQASGHWTGKTDAQRKREAKARADQQASNSTVARGISSLPGRGREVDKYVEMLKGKPK